MIRYAFSKVGMTTSFSSAGVAEGVTVLKMYPTRVVRHETLEDGRHVVVVEYDTGHKHKPQRGWIVDDASQFAIGSSLQSPSLSVGQKIKITGFSKGRGFQDNITRHGHHGGPGSHGSRFHRSTGSIGMRTEPGRVMKGKKMPGHDGDAQITLRNVKVAYWSSEEAVVAVVGGVPGARGSLVFF